MELILFGLLLMFFFRKKKGTPWDPFAPPKGEPLDPRLQAIIKKHRIDHEPPGERRVSAKYRNGP